MHLTQACICSCFNLTTNFTNLIANDFEEKLQPMQCNTVNEKFGFVEKRAALEHLF